MKTLISIVTAYLLFCVNLFGQVNLDSGLVAYYPFNGNLNDELGGYNATMGPSGSYAGGKINDGLHGGKACSNQIAARVDNFPNLDSFTIEVWIKPACPPGSWQGSLSIAKWVGGYSGPGFYIMAYPSPNNSSDYKFMFSLCDVARNTPSAVSPLTYLCGNWYHIVGIRDEGNEVKLFVNGEEVASAIDDAGSVANTQPLTFHGGLESSCDWGMSEITLDEVAIYNRVLTAEEIQALYHKFEIYVSIDSLTAFPNDTSLVPINVIFQQDSTYSSAEFIIEGYQNGLDFIQVDTSSSMTGAAGWSYAANEVGDSLVISWLAGAEDITGSGVFCNLKFAVTGEPCTFVPVNIKSALFNTGEDSVEITKVV